MPPKKDDKKGKGGGPTILPMKFDPEAYIRQVIFHYISF